MDSGEAATLAVAIVALVVSVVAAGFTGWQAVTGHLSRTRLPPARWAIAQSRPTWRIHNLGGSAGSDVCVRVTRLSEDVVVKSYPVGPVAPGEKSDLYWPGGLVPGGRLNGTADTLASTATVSWLDYRGKPRSTTVRLPFVS